MLSSGKKDWGHIVALHLTVHSLVGIALLFHPQQSDPGVVVLMDTPAVSGVSDEEDRAREVTNTEKLKEVLQDILPDCELHDESLASDWSREAAVAAMRPRLVIIHRNFGLANQFTRPTDDPRLVSHLQADDKLIRFMGLLGNEVRWTEFLIYSRGTDTNWLSGDFREGWVKGIEERFPKLKGRIETMVIPNGYNGTFGDPKAAEELRRRVKKILDLPDRPAFSVTSRKLKQIHFCYANTYR